MPARAGGNPLRVLGLLVMGCQLIGPPRLTGCPGGRSGEFGGASLLWCERSAGGDCDLGQQPFQLVLTFSHSDPDKAAGLGATRMYEAWQIHGPEPGSIWISLPGGGLEHYR